MKKFNVNNQVHEIEEGFEHLLPNDKVEITDQEAADLQAPTPEEAKKMFIAFVSSEVQKALDTEAQKLGYDSIHTAVTYAGETAVSKFATDGKSFRKWRSLVWAYCYSVLADYEAGNIEAPTIADMIAGLPTRT